jgi:hypothetical protein
MHHELELVLFVKQGVFDFGLFEVQQEGREAADFVAQVTARPNLDVE